MSTRSAQEYLESAPSHYSSPASRGRLNTHPVLLLRLKPLDPLQEPLPGPVQVVGQACDGDGVTLQLRRRHLNVHLAGEGKTNA